MSGTSRLWSRAFGSVVLCAQACAGVAADATTQLEEITVTSPRVDVKQSKVPLAIGAVTREQVQGARQELGLDESLGTIPGVFFQNRYNFAQDLRVSIRGFGARSQFGIRGVRIYADGIPLTLPDGQGGVDDLDLASTGRIEVIRGASSSLYGSASGGVISLFTEDAPRDPFVEARASAGDYGFERYQLKTGGQFGPINVVLSGNYTHTDGYRRQSAYTNTAMNARFRYDIDNASELTVVVNAFDSPQADDPGALRLVDVATNRRQAAPLNVQFDAGEAIDQQRMGFVYRRYFGDHHEIVLRNYYTWRDFLNRLPSAGTIAASSGGVVQFDRFFVGGGAQYNYSDTLFGHRNLLSLGIDVDSQSDDRQRYINNNGATGALTFDQLEEVLARGFYARNELSIREDLALTVGARYDVIDFDVTDRFFANTTGDDSGSADYDQWSPSVGLLWSPFEAVNLYTNYATSFETPTTTEFARPAGGGFNTALRPQTADSYEIGVKGVLPGQLRYDIALFHIDVVDELVPYEIGGRTFFENAADSTRNGLEASFSVQPYWLPGLVASLAYTYSDFQFDRYLSNATTGGSTPLDFSGNEIPGIPRHQVYSELQYTHPSGLSWGADVLFVDDYDANNRNSVTNEGYVVANVRVAYARRYHDIEVTPFLGVNNLFNQDYNGNVRVNPFNGNAATAGATARFFEPAPERNFYAGVTASYAFGR